jgi:hypothetical protein
MKSLRFYMSWMAAGVFALSNFSYAGSFEEEVKKAVTDFKAKKNVEKAKKNFERDEERAEKEQAKEEFRNEKRMAILKEKGIRYIIPVLYTSEVKIKGSFVGREVDHPKMLETIEQSDWFKKVGPEGIRVAFSRSVDKEKPNAGQMNEAKREFYSARVENEDGKARILAFAIQEWPGYELDKKEVEKRALELHGNLPGYEQRAAEAKDKAIRPKTKDR